MEETLDRHDIDFLLEPISEYLHTRPLDPQRWLLAYYDDSSVILLRHTAMLAENARRVRDYYSQFPDLLPHARWQFQLHSRTGPESPTRVPSVLDVGREEVVR